MPRVEVIRGDKLYDLQFTILDSENNAVDLTNSTVTFKVKKYGSTALEITGTCTITDAVNGICVYNVQANDFDVVQDMIGELEIVYTSGKIITAPDIRISVQRDLP